MTADTVLLVCPLCRGAGMLPNANAAECHVCDGEGRAWPDDGAEEEAATYRLLRLDADGRELANASDEEAR